MKSNNTSRFILTPQAIRDFREIYQLEGMTNDQAGKQLAIGAQSARLEHTKVNGSQVFKTLNPRKHYLLVGRPKDDEPLTVLAVAHLDEAKSGHWSLIQEGDLQDDAPVRLDPVSCVNPGMELRFARESLGLSLDELAVLLKQPKRRIESWEQGDIRSYASLCKIARAVGKLHRARILAYAHRFENRPWSAPS